MTSVVQKAAIVGKIAEARLLVDALAVEDPPTQEPPADDWTTLSANRLFARRLLSADASDANLAGRHPSAPLGVWSGDPAYTQPVIDVDGLKFPIETGKGINSWYAKFGRGFGANSTLCVQWKQRFNAAFISTRFKMVGRTDPPGIKLGVLSSAANTSDAQKQVLSTYAWMIPYLYGYSDLGGTTVNYDSPTAGWQPRKGEPTTCVQSGAWSTVPFTQTPPGCIGLVADDWITFDYIVQTGGQIPGTIYWDARRIVYMTIAGQLLKVIDFAPGMPGYIGRIARDLEAIWLGPYMTNRDLTQEFPVTPATWYRDLIIDDKPIGNYELEPLGAPPPPATSESADGTTVPPAPQILDAHGDIWTLSVAKSAVRNGVDMQWGALLALKYVKPEVWAQGDSGAWYRAVGDSLGAGQSTEPGTAPPPAPTAQTIDSFVASKSVIVTGESLTLSWQVTGATAVRLDGVAVAPNSTKTETPASSRNFVLEADGPAGTISRTVSVTVAAVPVPDPTLPSFVPPPGQYAQFTTNTLASVGGDNALLANWCGGVFIPDFGVRGSIGYHGGGEHFSAPDKGGTFMLDFDARQYVARNLSSIPHMQAMWTTGDVAIGSPTNEYGCYRDNDYPQRKHVYSCLSYRPKAWGNAPQGALMRVACTGGDDTAIGINGFSATYQFDLSQQIDGHTRISGAQRYTFDKDVNGVPQPARIDDTIYACIDTIRQGWWALRRASSGKKWLAFTAQDGTVTNFVGPPLTLTAWAKMHHFPDDDVLCIICDEPSFGVMKFGVVKLLQLGDPNAQWVTIDPSRPDDPELIWNGPGGIQAGYCGPQMSSLLQSFVCISRRPDVVRIWKLALPPAGQRFGGAWAWSGESFTSADGSTMNCYSDAGNVNGSFGKLIECPSLRALGWTRDASKPGFLIRPQGM